MYPEHGKSTDQKAGHGNKGIIKDRIFFTVMLTVGIELGEQGGCLGMTFAAGGNKVGFIYA